MDDQQTYDHHKGELNPDVHHEETDVNVRAILWFVVGFVVIMVLIYVAMAGLFVGFKRMEVRKDVEPLSLVRLPHPRVPPEPRLQVNPAQDMRLLSTAYATRLSTAGVDPATGVRHIPIDQAMKTVVAQGLPVRSEKPAAPVASMITPAATSTAGPTEPVATDAAEAGRAADTSGGRQPEPRP